MKKLTVVFVLLALVAYAGAEATQARPGVTINKVGGDIHLNDMAVAQSVENREPAGASDSHPANVGKLYCWTSIYNSGESTEVTHIWRLGKSVMTKVAMPVDKSTRWRTWSYQRISDSSTGNWECEIVDQSGASLGKATFTVQ